MAQAKLTLPQWLCVACVAAYKAAVVESVPRVANLADSKAAEAELPSVKTADVMLNGNTLCVEHVELQRQSPLIVANGKPGF
jgi:hypothetical protein